MISLINKARKPIDPPFSLRPDEIEEGMEINPVRRHVHGLEEGMQMERDEARRANQRMEERIKTMEETIARMMLESQKAEIQDGKAEVNGMDVDGDEPLQKGIGRHNAMDYEPIENRDWAKQYQNLRDELIETTQKHQSEIQDWMRAVANAKEDTVRVEELYLQSQRELNLLRNQNKTLRAQLETEQRTVRNYRAEERRTAPVLSKDSLVRKLEDRLREVERERDSLQKQPQTVSTRTWQSTDRAPHEDQTLLLKIRQLEKEKQNAALNAEVAAKERQSLTTRSKHLEVLLSKERGQIEEYKRRLQKVTNDLNLSQKVLADRTEELKMAQRFLSTADLFAGADLIIDLEQLNGEIMQVACGMADMAERIPKQTLTKGDRPGLETVESAKKILGSRLVDLLGSSEGREAKFVIQIAFQAAIVAYAHQILSTWFFKDKKDDHVINDIYESVRNAEGQAVAGRWRQLTRSHLRSRLLKQPHDLQPGAVETIANIMLLANYAVPDALVVQISKRFGNRINNIARLADSLNKKAGEGVTSCDFQFLHVAPNTPYNPGYMQDGIGFGHEAIRHDEGLVICTIALGMQRSEKSSEPKEQWKASVLVKPEVILTSGFENEFK